MVSLDRFRSKAHGKRVRPKPDSFGLRINGCSSNCRCSYTTYEKEFTDPRYHDPHCQYIYIDAPEQRRQASKADLQSLKVNQCVKTLTRGSSWRGPVNVFAIDIHKEYVDMRTKFFSGILGGFHNVVGVRINADKLVKARKTPRFEAVKIKSYDLRHRSAFHDDPFDDQGVAPLTLHTGIVLLVSWERSSETSDKPRVDSRNSIASLLSIPCEISGRKFGQYTRPSRTGSVVVMREDRKPLDVEYMRILCDWISNELRPLFKQASVECKKLTASGGAYIRQRDAVRERVLAHITKRRLLAYSGGRLRNEDNEDTEDEEMADIIENDDTTDDEMLEDGEEASDSDDDDGMFDDESSEIKDGDSAERFASVFAMDGVNSRTMFEDGQRIGGQSVCKDEQNATIFSR